MLFRQTYTNCTGIATSSKFTEECTPKIGSHGTSRSRRSRRGWLNERQRVHDWLADVIGVGTSSFNSLRPENLFVKLLEILVIVVTAALMCPIFSLLGCPVIVTVDLFYQIILLLVTHFGHLRDSLEETAL